MESVKVFDIEVDLGGVSRLYDYLRAEYISRPLAGWDPAALTSVGQKDHHPNETSAHLMSRMYKAHLEKGFFEGDKTKDTSTGSEAAISSFLFSDISPASKVSLPPTVLPVCRPGDVVRGQVKVEVSEEMDAESIMIKFKGYANTNIRIYHGRGFYDDEGEEVYAKSNVIVWQKTGSKVTSEDDEHALVSRRVQTGATLTPGKYSFPFEFQIPANARQSVPPVVDSHADFAYLSYYIKATIKRGKMFKRGNVVSHRGIWVERAVDLAKDPNNMIAVHEEKVQTTGLLTSGKVVCRASLPCRGYIRGSHNHVPLRLEVDNQSGGEINNVKACVVLLVSYRSTPKSWHGTKSTAVKGVRVYEGAIASGMCPQFDLKLPLAFHESGVDGNLIPAGTLDDCDLIDCKYEVYVHLKRKGMHRDVEMHIPINIGTENTSSVYPSLENVQLKD